MCMQFDLDDLISEQCAPSVTAYISGPTLIPWSAHIERFENTCS